MQKKSAFLFISDIVCDRIELPILWKGLPIFKLAMLYEFKGY